MDLRCAPELRFPSRLFSPLSRLRERGGGEGRRIHEVNRINSNAPASPPEFGGALPLAYRLPSFT
uniref:Uncharacterized protein n=1 Tax=Cupriavidus taiwanensis TaxID=164546 RepID=A0A375E617_9BURK|nr:hypothetical protein CBM2615_B10221 [Cupriavidus taiwanensis]SOZ62286.1 hypothetical protein CBM2614_B10128 [Cupriavidus taiwanensis]SOZ66321.1 hypothetical protein CBM2613_B10221 [Cupriavidus taiwanensis]SPA07525.1 hypothetical protein CBM2625_B10220 [Cupriavidus taiwanensis]